MSLLRHIQLLRDPSVACYIKSLLRGGNVVALSRTAMLALKSQRKIYPESLRDAIADLEVVRCSGGVLSEVASRSVRRKGMLGVDGKRAIYLPTISMICSEDMIEWSKLFEDREDSMALHRFNWAVRDYERAGCAPWKAISGWLDWVDSVCPTESLDVVMDSYTVSERICAFLALYNADPPDDRHLVGRLLERISKDCVYLSHNLEYYGYAFTNNHILNNARALVLAGACLKDGALFDLGWNLLCDQLPNHCSEGGAFREASAHYQWVITRWMVDAWIALMLRGQRAVDWYEDWVRRMLDTCECLSLRDGRVGYIPAIGDVSPDYPPECYDGMTVTAKNLIGRKEQCGSSVWKEAASAFFAGSYNDEAEIVPPKGWISDRGDWARLERGEWSFLLHSDNDIGDSRVRHGHQDTFSFELALGGKPLIVDRGRRDYRSPSWSADAGILDEYHNSLMIDGKRLGFYPRNFMAGEWLMHNRTRPVLEMGGDLLRLVMENPKAIRNVKNVKREWMIGNDEVLIRTSIDAKSVRHLEYYLYIVANTIESDGDRAFIIDTHEGQKVLLRIEGKELVSLTKAERYPSYGEVSDCWRLVFRGDTTTTVNHKFILRRL